MSEMVERVARAIAATEDRDFDCADGWQRSRWGEQARAAIAAMRFSDPIGDDEWAFNDKIDEALK